MTEKHKFAAARVYAQRRAWPVEPTQFEGQSTVILPAHHPLVFLVQYWRCLDKTIRPVVLFPQVVNGTPAGWTIPQAGKFPFSGRRPQADRGNSIAEMVLGSEGVHADMPSGQLSVRYPMRFDLNGSVKLGAKLPKIGQVKLLGVVEALARWNWEHGKQSRFEVGTELLSHALGRRN